MPRKQHFSEVRSWRPQPASPLVAVVALACTVHALIATGSWIAAAVLAVGVVCTVVIVALWWRQRRSQ